MPEEHKNDRLEKWAKIVSLILAAIAMLGVVGFCLTYFLIQIPLFDGSGWITAADGSRQYLNYYKVPLTHWQELDGKRYYFDPETCAMATGWLETEEGTFCLSSTGVMRTGWVNMDGKRYYLGQDGKLQTGWVDTPQGRCYADDTGAMVTGWLDLDEKRYYLAKDGTLQTGWLMLGADRYYLGEDGVMATGWMETDQGKYYFAQTGEMHTGWLETEAGLYYLQDNGVMYTGWLTIDTGRYYLREDGTAATGFAEVNGVTRYFMPDGNYIPLVNQWNHVPEDYETNLVEFEGYRVDLSCRDALAEMLDACREAGYYTGINSAYRSYEHQQRIRDEEYAYNLNAGMSSSEAWADMTSRVAEVGASEHHLGTAVDLSGGYWWLEQHSWEFGFIRRYPPYKRSVTGIIYEPWHYRYVGKELAKAIYDSGLCMEEYMEQLQQGNIP